MRRRPCPREFEVAQSVLADRGGVARSDDCRAHLETCAECRELIEVMAMLHSEHTRMTYDVTVPAAGQVWWRSAVRARLEAAQAAARPVTWAQGVTGATLLGVTCAALMLTWPALRQLMSLGWARWLTVWDASTLTALPPVLAVVERGLPLVLVVMAAVVLTPLLVLYFALAGED